MDANMMRRVAVAAIGIPLALAIVWYGGWPLAILIAVIAVLGVRELNTLAAGNGVQPLGATGTIAAAFLPLATYAALIPNRMGELWMSSWRDLALLWFLAILFVTLRHRTKEQRPLAVAAVTLFGVIYAAAMPTFLLEIRHAIWPPQSWAGAALVFFPLVVTWIADTAAMFGGRAMGGAKLAPAISPGKTRAGAIWGVVGALLVAPLFTIVIFPRAGVEVEHATAIVTALLIGVAGQAGDLVESLFKREAGVKDSSNLIPGHGGVLDRLDSLYVAIPLAALCYRVAGLI